MSRHHFGHAAHVLEYERVREVLTSYAASSLGRRLAARMEPLNDASRLRKLLDETVELDVFLETERLPLSGVSDVFSEVRSRSAQGQPCEPEFFYRVLDLLRAGNSLREVLTRDPQRFPRLSELGSGIEDLADLREQIPLVVDPRDGVRDDASEKLGRLRNEIRERRESLRERSNAVLRRADLRKCFQAEGVTVKNDRYLLPVKAEYRAWVHGPVRDRSQSGATLYVEPDEILLEGDRLIDLLDAARDEELRILWDLTRSVLDARPVIDRIQRRVARIDFTYAKASFARALGLNAPEINTEGVLELKEARNPYLMWLGRDVRRDLRDIDTEAIRRKVVPLDVRLGAETRLLIVTGPNTGGKTVALKTIGLNVLLGLSGVPIAAATGSRIPLYNDLFVDIGDEQSLEQSLSTFSSHLRQIVEVLRHATRRSLILLDELGSGTDPLEGAALGRALLDYIRERGWTAIITTHLGSLKEYAYVNEGAENAAMEFDQHSLRPTYRLLMGVPGSSNALAIARRLGVKAAIIEAAENDIARAEAPTREVIERMQRSKRRVEKERRRAERVRRRAQDNARVYEARLEEVQARKEALDREAELEVERAVRAARDRLSPLVQRLKNVPQAHRPLVDELDRQLRVLLASTPLGERREVFARSLRKDDEVYVPKFRSRAKVRKINKGDRSVVVLINGIPTELSFDDLSWIDGPSRSAGGAEDL